MRSFDNDPGIGIILNGISTDPSRTAANNLLLNDAPFINLLSNLNGFESFLQEMSIDFQIIFRYDEDSFGQGGPLGQ